MIALTSKELLAQQLDNTVARGKAKGIKPPTAIGISYNSDLQRIVREISKDVNATIMPLVRSLAPQYQRDSAIETRDNWVDTLIAAFTALQGKWTSQQFVALSNRIASQFVRDASQTNEKRFADDMRVGFGIDVFSDSQQLRDYLAASAYDNARLIQSIPDQYLKNVESIVMTNVRAGGRPSSIAKSLTEQFGVTSRRAKMIARDQTAKINGDLTKMRQQNVGFEYFQWIDADDQRVRTRHKDIDEKVTAYGKGVYRWDNPPLSSKGIPIIPGVDYQCRCIARPVSNAEVEANQKAGRVTPGVYR